MLWACIRLPHLALDGVLRLRAPSDAPLALIAGTAQQRVLIAVNAAACGLGLYAGQSLAAAEVLCRKFETIEHDPQRDVANLRLLAAWAYRYSSQVSTDLPRAVMLEVEGSLKLFGPWPTLQARLHEGLQALGFRHRIALAPTARAAFVLAGVGDGLCVTTHEVMRRALARVPLSRAQLPNAAADALSGMGVRTLGDVLALPRDGLNRRFGQALLDHLDSLLGLRPEILDFYRPPDRFDARVEWAHEIHAHQALLFPLRRLIADLAAYLAGRDGGVQRYLVRLQHEHEACTDMSIGLLAPERAPELLFEVARIRLEQVQLCNPVIGLRVVAEELPPFVPAGSDLFDARTAQSVTWLQLRERLRARLGETAVHGLSVDPDPRPERAWKYQDVSVDTANVELPLRPTWLLMRPIPLRGPPPRILAGPERLETGWWDGGDVRRDYYLIETSLGQRAWAFCPPGEQIGWMLQGWFA